MWVQGVRCHVGHRKVSSQSEESTACRWWSMQARGVAQCPPKIKEKIFVSYGNCSKNLECDCILPQENHLTPAIFSMWAMLWWFTKELHYWVNSSFSWIIRQELFCTFEKVSQRPACYNLHTTMSQWSSFAQLNCDCLCLCKLFPIIFLDKWTDKCYKVINVNSASKWCGLGVCEVERNTKKLTINHSYCVTTKYFSRRLHLVQLDKEAYS